MFAWLLSVVLLAAPPPVSLARGSACAPREVLSRELARLGVALVADAPLLVRLTPGSDAVELLVERDGAVVLRRTLRGSCDDAAVATAVVLERYLRDIGSVSAPEVEGGANERLRVDAGAESARPALSDSQRRERSDAGSSRTQRSQFARGDRSPSGPQPASGESRVVGRETTEQQRADAGPNGAVRIDRATRGAQRFAALEWEVDAGLLRRSDGQPGMGGSAQLEGPPRGAPPAAALAPDAGALRRPDGLSGAQFDGSQTRERADASVQRRPDGRPGLNGAAQTDGSLTGAQSAATLERARTDAGVLRRPGGQPGLNGAAQTDGSLTGAQSAATLERARTDASVLRRPDGQPGLNGASQTDGSLPVAQPAATLERELADEGVLRGPVGSQGVGGAAQPDGSLTGGHRGAARDRERVDTGPLRSTEQRASGGAKTDGSLTGPQPAATLDRERAGVGPLTNSDGQRGLAGGAKSEASLSGLQPTAALELGRSDADVNGTSNPPRHAGLGGARRAPTAVELQPRIDSSPLVRGGAAPGLQEERADAESGRSAEIGWSVLVGGGLLLPAPGVLLAPAISLEPQLRRGPWRATLLAIYSNGGSVPVVERTPRAEVTRGALSARDGLLMSSLGYCSTGRISVCGALLAGLRLVFAQAAGPLIFQTSSGVASAFTASAAVDVTLALGVFRVAVGVAVLINPLPAKVSLEAIPAFIATPLVEGVARASVGMGSVIP